MGLEEGLLALIKMPLEKFKFKSRASTSPAPILSLNLSQHNSIEQILILLQQRNKQVVRMWKLLRVLERKAKLRPNTGFQAEITKLSLFNKKKQLKLENL